MTDRDLFAFLRGDFQAIYADLLAATGRKPVNLIHEFDAVLWHLAVASDAEELGHTLVRDDNLAKGLRHLQRAALDAATLLWLFYKERVDDLLQDKDIVKFCTTYSEQRLKQTYEEAVDKSIEARNLEHDNVGRSPAASLRCYHESALLYRAVLKMFDAERVVAFRRFRLKYWFKDHALAIILGLITGILSSLIATWLMR